MNFSEWGARQAFLALNANRGAEDVPLVYPPVLNEELTTTQVVGFVDNRTYGNLYGTMAFKRHRIDLELLFKNIPPVLPIWKLDNVYAILTRLNEYYGLALDPSEFNEALDSFNWRVLPQTLTLTAKDTAVSCTGSITFEIIQEVADLQDVVITTDTDTLYSSVNLNTDKLALPSRYYNYDFTAFRSVLSTVDETFNVSDLLPILNDPTVLEDCGNITWGDTYDINTLTFVYNGPTANYTEATISYTNVLVLACSDPDTNEGNLLLHYDA
jgi:hypothetical protein